MFESLFLGTLLQKSVLVFVLFVRVFVVVFGFLWGFLEGLFVCLGLLVFFGGEGCGVCLFGFWFFLVPPPKPFSFAAVAGCWIMLQDLWDATMARLLQVPSLSN